MIEHFLLLLSEFLIVVPAAFFCFSTSEEWRRASWRTIGLGLLATLAALVVSAAVCAAFELSTNTLLLPLCLPLFLAFLRSYSLGPLRSLFVFLTAAAMCAFVTYLAILVDVVFGTTIDPHLLALPGAAAQWVLSLVVLLALPGLPAHRIMVGLLRSEATGPRFWRLAWTLPFAICAFLMFLIPEDPATILTNRMSYLSFVGIICIWALVVGVYALMWRLAVTSSELLAAREERHALDLRTMQLEHMNERIDEVRRARHDLRQHFAAIGALAAVGDVEGIRDYLRERGASVPAEGAISYCADPALNAIVVLYADRAIEAGARVDVEMRLPDRLTVSHADLSVVLGNLLENAVEELEGAGGAEGGLDGIGDKGVRPKFLRVRAVADPGGTLFVTVDNTLFSPVQQAEDGAFRSTKHEGMGIGTESVAAITRRLGGIARFEHDDEAFHAPVMLPST